MRRLLRRAARHGKKLGIEGEFLAALSRTVIDLSKDGYPELEEKSAMIFKVLSEEEDKSTGPLIRVLRSLLIWKKI